MGWNWATRLAYEFIEGELKKKSITGAERDYYKVMLKVVEKKLPTDITEFFEVFGKEKIPRYMTQRVVDSMITLWRHHPDNFTHCATEFIHFPYESKIVHGDEDNSPIRNIDLIKKKHLFGSKNHRKLKKVVKKETKKKVTKRCK